MVERIYALVKPELLEWGRNSAHMDLQEAGDKTGIKPEKLKEFEEGTARITIPQLRKLANAYQRP